MEYNFKDIEDYWQHYWATNKTFSAQNNSDKPKYYVLDMFPYPSGAGLHVGHPLGYIASDIVARYKRHKGFNVLHPMGYDSFGLPAEQYAIQTGQHPKITTEQNIARYRQQLDKIGFSFDWDREVRTSNPEYYKWTQWIFIQLFNSWYNKSTNKAENISSLVSAFETNGNATIHAHCDDTVKTFTAVEWKAFNEKEQSDILMAYRIAYLGEAYVNWCPQLGTVLANDEVKDGVSERGGYPVERKLMKQWSMRITAYAQRLLDGLDTLDWTDSLKEAQRNWIGRSEGTSLKFQIADSKLQIDSTLNTQHSTFIEVFTTRPDTIFGVAFVTLAPEHELVSALTKAEQNASVEEYVTVSKNRSERERQADVNKITGVFTGSYVTHPFTGKQIPIWVGDYVLAGYGTGAVMAVPAHDERDYKFANHFNIEFSAVIQPPVNRTLSDSDTERSRSVEAWTEKEGTLINSDFLNGLDVKAAIKKAIAEIEKQDLGKGKTNYRLRDAVFGRQRYWGEPIPIYYKNDIPYALRDNELPLVLPEVDKYLPTEDGEPPLARAKDWRYKPLSNSPHGGENAKPHSWETASNSVYEFTKEKAEELRANQTEAEKVLWEAIRRKSLDSKFRRQHIIGSNIVDFVSLDAKLVIEVDGKIHLSQQEYDESRTQELGKLGFTVIRFSNEEILHDLENVLTKIKSSLTTQQQVLPLGEDLGGASYPYEHSTMPGWAGSSWYFLRYMDANNDKEFVSKKLADYWQQVDLYIGGSEHATGHLLYVRFWTKFLNDLGHIAIDEPAKKLINQGMIQGRSSYVYRTEGLNLFVSKGYFDLLQKEGPAARETIALEVKKQFGDDFYEKFKTTSLSISINNVDVNFVDNDVLNVDLFKNWRDDLKDTKLLLEDGKYNCGFEIAKMSKRWYNVVTPDSICEKHGADTLRLYEMFLGPLEQSKPWNTNGITGVHGFLKKLWRLFYQTGASTPLSDQLNVSNDEPTKAELKTLHKTIKKVIEDIERFSFNTSISTFMICVNELTEAKCNKREILEPLLICLSPYAPHIAEELWKQLGHAESISTAPFPEFKEEYLLDDAFSYPVSFNGKMRFNLELPTNLTPQEIEAEVLKNENTIKYLEGKAPKKVVVVPKRIVNIVM